MSDGVPANRLAGPEREGVGLASITVWEVLDGISRLSAGQAFKHHAFAARRQRPSMPRRA